MDLKSTKEVYKNGSITLTEKIFVSDGKEITRVSLSLGKNTVLIIPVDSDGNFYLGQQKRAGSDNFIIEFPNGGIEEGEDILDSAKRELSEELGLTGEMEFIGKFKPFSGLVDLEVNVVISKNTVEQSDLEKLRPDFYENIERRKFSKKEIYEMIKTGKINQSYFLSSLSLYESTLVS